MSRSPHRRRPSPPVLRPGDAVADRYRVRSVLDSTGITQVFEGFDERDRTAVALCVVSPPRGAMDTGHAEQQWTASSAIRHPHVARPHRFLKLGGHRTCLVTDRIVGVGLDRVAEELAPLAPMQVATLLTGIGRGLDAIHEYGVTHGRLTLRKLMLGHVDHGRDRAVGAVIVGLGTSPLTGHPSEPSHATVPTDAATAPTVAPEVAAGRAAHRRADVYSLASIAFDLVAGRPPFQDDNAIRLLARKIAGEAPRLREVSRVPIPPRFEAVVAQGLERDPARRPRSAGELVLELRRCTGAETLPVAKRSSILANLLDGVLFAEADRATDELDAG